MPKPYSRLFLTTILAATLLTSSAASVDWPVDGGDGQRRWYKQTFYDTSGNENASTYNLGCTINRFYIHDNTIYAECGDTIHKIQLTYPNLTYAGNFTITGDMLGILQGNIIALAKWNGLRAYDQNGTILWTAGNITYYKWNNTDYTPTTYTPAGSNYEKAWLTENHAYVTDRYNSRVVIRAYDLSGSGIGLFTCGDPTYTMHSWSNIAEDGKYLIAKCSTYNQYGCQAWHTAVTYNLEYGLYDHGVTCASPLIRGASNESLVSCTPKLEMCTTPDISLIVGSTNKYQFYGFSSNEPDARNYLNLSETIDNATNYESRACYDEANWYETSGTNLTKFTIPRTTPVWSVKVGTAVGPGKPICLENVILVVNSSGAILSIDKQTGTIQNSIKGFTANQFLIGGANTITSTADTKIYHTSPRTTTTTTILKPDLTIQKITWQKT